MGEAALASFVFCALSGVLLLPVFDAHESALKIAQWLLVNPGATLLRNAHYWTAQAVLVLVMLHVWDHLRGGTERWVKPGVWLRLVISLPAIAFLMLSGFLLRGDADAQQAWRLLEQMLGLIPVVGELISQFMLGHDEGALTLVSVQHAATATCIVWLAIVEHTRRMVGGVRAMGLIAVATGVLAGVLSAGLHDGLSQTMKGPWYFLGLQELLHWSSRPAWVVVAAIAMFVLLIWVRGAAPGTSAFVKRALFAAGALYVVLCVLVLFVRGPNWSFAVEWPAGPADLRAGPVLERVTLNGAKARLPLILGRPEGCMACHAGMTGFSPSHNPDILGCSSCHAGDPFSLDSSRAHRGMIRVPGDLQNASRSCGREGCHADVVPRVERSIMATFAGVISTNRSVFGESTANSESPEGAHARRLGRTAADTHLRQLCVSCHLAQPKTDWGPIDQNSRGGGCNACHLNYSPDALAGLQSYRASQARHGVAVGAVPRRPNSDPPRVHPRLSVHASNDHCFGCHSRSGRISTSFEGWHEMRHPPAPDARSADPRSFRQLQDGRYFERKSPDVHYLAGLACIDCHTALEVMGADHAVRRKSEALRVRCADCHASPGGRLASREVQALDPESRKLLGLRGWRVRPEQQVAVTRGGDALYAVAVDEQGRAAQRLKADGKVLPLKPQAIACASDKAHARLSCASCHTAWAPTCTSCHTYFDPSAEGYDYLAGERMVGKWVEKSVRFDARPPTLGVRRTDGYGESGADIVDTFVPGMVMTLDRNMTPNGASSPAFVRLFAPIAAHTVQRASRSCTSCHADPVAIGFGQGTLRFEIDPAPQGVGATGKTGHWYFLPKQAVRPEDGLPDDGWVSFLQEGRGGASSHAGARGFNLAEQRRILTVGACLACHDEQSVVTRASLQDPESTLKRRTPLCATPRWN